MPMSKQKRQARGERAAAIQAESLARRQELLSFIETHGPVLTTTISAQTKVKRTSLFVWLRDMEEQGYVVHVSIPGEGTGNRSQNMWSRGPNREPLQLLKAGGSVGVPVKPEILRKVVKAQQVGMAPDAYALPREFFGRQVGA